MPLLSALILRRSVTTEGTIRVRDVPFEANTLGEAIAVAESLLKIRVIPHDPPKWFRVYAASGSSEYALADIHVRRGDATICPKQDLSFPLLPSDTLTIGELAC